MNIYTQMQQNAQEIVPGVNLRRLLIGRGQRFSKADRLSIAKLLRSGRCYLTATWLAYYYPVHKECLKSIELDLKIKIERPAQPQIKQSDQKSVNLR